MARYTVPVDTREKEKIVGGFLTMNQLYWLIGGLISGMILFVTFFQATQFLPISIFAFIIGFLTSLPFVFYTKNNLTLWQYLTRKRKFLKKTHRLVNKRVVK